MRAAWLFLALALVGCAEETGRGTGATPWTVDGASGKEDDPDDADTGDAEIGGTDDSGPQGDPPGCDIGTQDCPCTADDRCKLGLSCDAGVCAPCDGCDFCGNGSCGVTEDCLSCPADCDDDCTACGDDVCDPGEGCDTCVADCGACEACSDGTCDPGEDCQTCPADCGACGPSCGDGQCDAGESCASCATDCPCPVDPCVNANAGNGDYCGEGIGGTTGVLYTCSGGVSIQSEPCSHGCASCIAGTADRCKAYAGQSSAAACGG